MKMHIHIAKLRIFSESLTFNVSNHPYIIGHKTSSGNDAYTILDNARKLLEIVYNIINTDIYLLICYLIQFCKLIGWA